jgi:acyl-CoA thioesterase FadM
MFGLKPTQVEEAGQILRQIARDWRELIAGSEGFLTGKTRRALFRHSLAWGEMDVMGHINNVNYVKYAETARVNLMRNYAMHIDPAHRKEWLGMASSTGIGLILRSMKVDYKFPMVWPDKITVYHKLVHNPSSSLSSQSAFEHQVVILSEARQRTAARCHEDNVIYDYNQQRKAMSMPPFIMEQLENTWAMQEETKEIWRQQISNIEKRVRELETQSWDREDAVEDLGSATGR